MESNEALKMDANECERMVGGLEMKREDIYISFLVIFKWLICVLHLEQSMGLDI